jgi:hypothetical protein
MEQHAENRQPSQQDMGVAFTRGIAKSSLVGGLFSLLFAGALSCMWLFYEDLFDLLGYGEFLYWMGWLVPFYLMAVLSGVVLGLTCLWITDEAAVRKKGKVGIACSFLSLLLVLCFRAAIDLLVPMNF